MRIWPLSRNCASMSSCSRLPSSCKYLLVRQRDRVRGFTLVEVLVAMAILAIGVSALVTASGASAFRSKQLGDREFGRWIAANHLNTLQAMPGAPDVGTSNTEVEMMNRTWYVRTRTRKEDFDIRRMDIEVRLTRDSENYVYSVTGFAGDPKHRL